MARKAAVARRRARGDLEKNHDIRRCGTGRTAEISHEFTVGSTPYFSEIGAQPFMLDKNTSDGAH